MAQTYRYDVRAALSDLSQYEPPPGGYTNRLECLTPAEQRAEQLCEEERYYSLYHNEEEEQMYQGKVWKVSMGTTNIFCNVLKCIQNSFYFHPPP